MKIIFKLLFAICIFNMFLYFNKVYLSNDKDFIDNIVYKHIENKSNYSTKPDITSLEKKQGKLQMKLIPFVYNSLHKLENIDDTEHSSKVLKRFEYLVCAEPGRLDESDLIVISNIKEKVKIFGYVNMGGEPLMDINKIKSEIDNIKENSWYGVFIDQFGFDFGETRERQNIILNYAHSKGLKCFVNSWFIEDAFGDEYDNIHNPKGLSTQLQKDDWYLIESFYTSNSGVSMQFDNFKNKIELAKKYKEKFGVKIACLTYKRNELDWLEAYKDIDTSYFMALLQGFDGYWYTDKLEYDSFIYGNFNYNVGDKIETTNYELLPKIYFAETDKYIFTINLNEYPLIYFRNYDKSGSNNLINKHTAAKAPPREGGW